ncbi:unnamed protein product [Bursaphelenchus okinawaensis]|uniref:Endoplasmic reticulum junction formation protein lunapark n=1 Tax=Bursaphelenchus okinawaensis TaxID=465554 RepID=A0A811KHJ6_9BILA|nr:unnamed protein product [Bursaphelenchus okinawaensis]CAG9103301.1 unnamed protein product [Bursaphelenchus okinawaensis]
MGNILRRHRNSVDELEQILKHLHSYELRSQTLRKGRYNVMWYFTALLLFSVTVYSAMSCMESDDTRSMYQKIALAWFTGILLFMTVRFLSGRCFDFLLGRSEKNIVNLNNRRTQILEDVKENEKFNVAKEIIEKYGSEQDLAEIGVVKEPSPGLNGLRQNSKTKQNLKRPAPPKPEPKEETEEFARPKTPEQLPQAGSSTDLALRTPSMPMNRTLGLRTPIMRQPIRPFVQVSRTPIDKIIDYIIGDGPSNRFALICKQCHAHNGMALREEFDGISFVCYNCQFYNPARNAQPLRTPRRLNVQAIEETKPLIRTATNTDSSDNDDQEQENSQQPWVSETECPDKS